MKSKLFVPLIFVILVIGMMGYAKAGTETFTVPPAQEVVRTVWLNEGWHTYIILGDSPFGSEKHAWLLVECEQGEYMPVESTNIEVVWWDDPHFDNYFTYSYEFETIQEAIAYNENDFDWWK